MLAECFEEWKKLILKLVGENKEIEWPGITWKRAIIEPEQGSSHFKRYLKASKANILKTACTYTLIGDRVLLSPMK